MKQLYQQLLHKLNALYNLNSLLSNIEPVVQGYLSTNYIVSNEKEKYFLKQYRFTDISIIQEVHQAKFFFAQAGIPIILPIASKNNDFIFEYEGKFYTLFPFINGRIILKKDRPIIAYQQAGEMLGKIHLVGKDYQPNENTAIMHFFNPNDFFIKAKNVLSSLAQIQVKTEFDQVAEKTLRLKIDLITANQIRPSDLELEPNHLTHGDYHGRNMFFNGQDEIIAIFDLEKTEMAPRSFELARSMDFMCFSNQFDNLAFQQANAYLQAYAKAYPINKQELACGLKLYYLQKMHSLWIEGEHYLSQNYRVDHFLYFEYKMLLYFNQHLPDIINKLQL